MTGPTKIIKQPVDVRQGIDRDGKESGHLVMIITCDDDCQYTVKDLAKKLEINWQKLYRRLRKHPWDHPEILAKEMSCEKRGGPRPGAAGNDLWQNLSEKKRFYKLADLPRAGVLEIRLTQQKESL
ncbi:MAG: hypothetical protein ACOYB1_18555 [Limnohabitans sp.]